MKTAPETQAATEKVGSKNSRDAEGRFAPGNPGGPGNPYARQVAAMRKAMLDAVSIEELQRIVCAIKKKAEEGDVAAAKLIFQYVLGKPTTPADPDLLAFDEWQKLQKLARPPREMDAMLHSVPAQVACDLTHVAWPCSLETNFDRPFREGLKKLDERDAKRAAAKGKTSPAAAPKANGEKAASVPKANGDNGASGAVGVLPIPNPDDGEDEEWLRRIAREMFGEETSRNGTNGTTGRNR